MATRDINPLMLGGATINRNSPQAAGLVAAWHPGVFPGGGTLYDRAGVNHGTISGADWTTDARRGHVLNFIAANSDNVNGAHPSIVPPLTIMTWFKTGAAGTARPFNIYESGYEFRYFAVDANVGNDFTYWFRYTSDTKIEYSGETPVANTWYCMVGVSYALNSHALYVNGVLKATDATDIITAPAISNVGIGALMRPVPWYSDCVVAECRVYDRALSAAEIMAIYQNPYDLWMPVGEMAMDEGYVTAGVTWPKAPISRPFPFVTSPGAPITLPMGY